MTSEEIAEVRELHYAISHRTTMNVEFGGNSNEDHIIVVFTVPDRFADDCSHPGEIIRRVTEYRDEKFIYKDAAIAFLIYIENKLGK